MFETSATRMGKEFHELLGRVADGESIRIRKRGRAVARLVPECEFMTGAQAAKLFRGYKPDARDKAAADAIEAELAIIRLEEDRALDH